MAGVLATTLGMAGAAHAASAIPIGTPVGTATDTLTIAGVYSSGTGSAPFAVPGFTLSFVIPQEVSIANPVGPPPDGLFRTESSGVYTDGTETTAFTTSYLEFGDFTTDSNMPATNPASQVSDPAISNFLSPGDSFSFYVQTALEPIYTFSNGGNTATAATGLFPLTSGSVTYAGSADPPFQGTITVTPNGGVSAAPEPRSWALMILGVGVAGLVLRQGRRRPSSARIRARPGALTPATAR